MASKVVRSIARAAGALLLAVVAFLALFVIGYSMVALFSRSGFESSAARAVGTGIAAAVCILLLALYFSAPARPSQGELSRYHPARKRVA